jgi:hypothetical protein
LGRQKATKPEVESDSDAFSLSSVPARDAKMLWGAASGRCSYPKCAKRLVARRAGADLEVLLGEMAHIVAKSAAGPRGEVAIATAERNRYGNLILLCEEHHKIVDSQRVTYTPELLRQFKQDHEQRCQQPFADDEPLAAATQPWVTDALYGTFMPVLDLPKKIYSAECVVSSERELKNDFKEQFQRWPPPFIIRDKKLWAFDDLRGTPCEFSRWIYPDNVERHSAFDMWKDFDLRRYYMALLNRPLRDLAASRRLRQGSEEFHWYFPPNQDGSEVSIVYQPMNLAASERKVAWQPVSRKTNEKKKYWEHLAIGMNFIQIADASWVLVLRPERHFTRDGKTPLTSRGTTRRSTSRASHLYNGDMLEDCQFWRSHLADGKPRIIRKVGGQHIVIDARLVSGSISWPGVPDDAKSYRNADDVEDDLFSLADYQETMDEGLGNDEQPGLEGADE